MSVPDTLPGKWVEVDCQNKEQFFAKRFSFLDPDKMEMMKSKMANSKISVILEKAAGGGVNLKLQNGDEVIANQQGLQPGVEKEIMTPMGVKMKGLVTVTDKGMQLTETDPQGHVATIEVNVIDGQNAKMVHSFEGVSMIMTMKKQ